MNIDRDSNNNNNIHTLVTPSNIPTSEVDPSQADKKEAHVTINEIAEEVGIIQDAYSNDRSYFSDGESKPKEPRLVKIKGYQFPRTEIPDLCLKDHIEQPTLRVPKKRAARSHSFSNKMSPRDHLSPRDNTGHLAEKQNAILLGELKRSALFNQAIQDHQDPLEILLKALSDASANPKKNSGDGIQSPRRNLKTDAKRKKSLQNQVDILSTGFLWKAKNKDTIRNTTDVTQLFRGQRQFQTITVNGIANPYPLSDEDNFVDYDETKPHQPEDIPQAIYQFYNNLFIMLAANGYDFGAIDREENLRLLFNHEKKNVCRPMLKFLQCTNMSMWGYCHMELTRTLPQLFAAPYKTAWNRAGLNGVPNTISCDIDAEKKKIFVTQKKNYALFIKATGMVEQDTLLATFTVSWKVRLPKSGQKFKALLSVNDLKWCAEASDGQKVDFINAFTQQQP